jgi:hypothetical protein
VPYLRIDRNLPSAVSTNKIVLAQKFPECPTVLLHGECSATNVPLVCAQTRQQKIVLESPHGT